MDPLTCTSSQSCCFKCGKMGHFPKSLLCKARNTAKKKKKLRPIPKRVPMSKEILVLLRKRIDEIESLKLKEAEISCEIPNSGKQETLVQESKMDFKSAKCILKAAEYCARKFSNKIHEERSE